MGRLDPESLLRGFWWCPKYLRVVYRQGPPEGVVTLSDHEPLDCAPVNGQLQCGTLVSLLLNQDVQHLAFGVDGAPEIYPPTGTPTAPGAPA